MYFTDNVCMHFFHVEMSTINDFNIKVYYMYEDIRHKKFDSIEEKTKLEMDWLTVPYIKILPACQGENV